MFAIVAMGWASCPALLVFCMHVYIHTWSCWVGGRTVEMCCSVVVQHRHPALTNIIIQSPIHPPRSPPLSVICSSMGMCWHLQGKCKIIMCIRIFHNTLKYQWNDCPCCSRMALLNSTLARRNTRQPAHGFLCAAARLLVIKMIM